ncbi:metal ABC transporter solute-binding protein, Zn/Mn family [Acidomonas methanolica]|uniref:ABC transporter Mn2+/Zn2+ permease n=1 Tax=Acidomonas methanolica NBRC 104435 TaxID=1231351 RepID=A0A023D7N7_ACIMT|nr:zinc ABC transporter substrate-binding protein [Acidomonas methanolica]MBU2655236.1 zinc ABC transporter substrate-binding protein [Acidomonas methanolica]TCS25593.1 zinc/manganese transport system substrate-binding protein [Acidomonas methanolica]GAJ30144.1 ABC transporter Mn2+/Zn2+ permease [Acidomonas methanolica NBRC 104435]GBQ56528.1 ABC transporter substrate-binding periplasmic protein [Acidomonas methanolica]GEK98718.1 hypothetical protein AME01nite_12170 [Acidomonas methanolica NBRC
MFRFFLFLSLVLAGTSAQAAPLRVVCAEAVWCDIARQLGGESLSIAVLPVSPLADPHDVMATPAMARQVAEADWLVLNGGGYDLWAQRLASGESEMLDIAKMLGAPKDANPHFFDDPEAVARVAAWMTARLTARFPARAAIFRRRADSFAETLAQCRARIAALKPTTQGKSVAVTEPVGGPFLLALGMRVMDERLALAVMHREEPPARDVAAVETALAEHRVAMLVINPAVTSPATLRLEEVARAHDVPVVALAEMPPPGMHWQRWYQDRLEAVAHAVETSGR